MFRALNRLLVAALAAGAMFAAPSAALADCGGGPSAQHVYSECVTGASGGKHIKAPPTSGGQVGSNSTSPISSRTATALKNAGKDSRTLQAWVHGAGKRTLQSPHSGDGSEPSALGSAFDLGSGPLALLALLGGTALLLLGGGGLRVWRARHRV